VRFSLRGSANVNRKGAEVAAIFFDEESHRWRIVSKAEPVLMELAFLPPRE